MTDPKQPSAKRNGSRGQRSAKVEKTGLAPLGYIAMHEINAAMCMAGGMIGPRFEDGAARDHHFSACGLVIEDHLSSKEALSAAFGGLRYGEVVIFEVLMPVQGPCILPSLPLLYAKRLVFRTKDAKEQFLARFSGFGDIPLMAVPLAVSPELFSGMAKLALPDIFPAIVKEDPVETLNVEASVTTTPTSLMRTIDRCAGSLLAALGTTRLGGHAGDILKGFGDLDFSIPEAQAAACFATRLAVNADGGPEANLFAPIFGSVATVLCSGLMDAGFSASELQKLAQPESTKGLEAESKNLKAIESMWSFTKDVLSLRRDVPEGAWSDIGGSPLARGTLFFLLNPEPEQLQVARIKNPNLGPRVHLIAGLLVGLRAGLTRLGKETKEDTGSFLTATAFVHTWLSKSDVSLEYVRYWDPNDGTPVDNLRFNGRELASARMPIDFRLHNLAAIIRTAGVDARFSYESGALSYRFEGEKTVVTFALSDTALPTYPRIHLQELIAAVESKSTKRDIEKCLEAINFGKTKHGVSASFENGPNRPYLRLSAYLAIDISEADLTEAVAAIVTSVRLALNVFSTKEKKANKILGV
jgi:hypothetical protein